MTYTESETDTDTELILTAEFIHQLPSTQCSQHRLHRENRQTAIWLTTRQKHTTLWHYSTESICHNRLHIQEQQKPRGRAATSLSSPVNGSQDEFDQQDGALLRVDGVGGGQAFAELVEQGGHQVFQSGHRDDGVHLHYV